MINFYATLFTLRKFMSNYYATLHTLRKFMSNFTIYMIYTNKVSIPIFMPYMLFWYINAALITLFCRELGHFKAFTLFCRKLANVAIYAFFA